MGMELKQVTLLLQLLVVKMVSQNRLGLSNIMFRGISIFSLLIGSGQNDHLYALVAQGLNLLH